MTADALAFVQFFFESTWAFFTSWKVPGTDATPASLLLLVLVVAFTLKVVKKILEGGYSDDP